MWLKGKGRSTGYQNHIFLAGKKSQENNTGGIFYIPCPFSQPQGEAAQWNFLVYPQKD